MVYITALNVLYVYSTKFLKQNGQKTVSKKINRITMRFERIMVEVTGLEPAASCSQSRRATTCATPRYFYINFYLISLFSTLLCPPSCGSRNLFGSIMSLDIPTAAPKNARFFCHRQRSRFLPKAGALPPALHLDTAII